MESMFTLVILLFIICMGSIVFLREKTKEELRILKQLIDELQKSNN